MSFSALPRSPALCCRTPAGRVDRRRVCCAGRSTPCSTTPWCTMGSETPIWPRPAWNSPSGTETGWPATYWAAWGSGLEQVCVRESREACGPSLKGSFSNFKGQECRYFRLSGFHPKISLFKCPLWHHIGLILRVWHCFVAKTLTE